jgi:type II secretion system protein N
MTPGTRTVLKWLGYPAWFLFCTVAFMYCTFPYDRVREKVRVAIEESMNADVEIDDLSPSWVTGVEVTGLRIKTRPVRASDTPKTFVIDSLRARVGVLALVTGGMDLSYTIGVYGGEIEGRLREDGPNATVEVEFTDLDLAQVQTLREAIGLPIAGLVSGDANLTLLERALSKSDGAIRLRGRGLRVGDGKAKLQIPGFGGLTIDPIEIGELQGELAVKAGKATISRLGAQGRDLELIGEGKIDLRDPLPASSVQSYVRFKILPAYTQRHARMAPLVSGLDMMPTTKRAKRPDGFLGYRVSGTFSRGLSFLPSTRAPMAREPRTPRTRGRVPRPRNTGATRPTDEALDPAIAGPPANELPDEQSLSTGTEEE